MLTFCGHFASGFTYKILLETKTIYEYWNIEMLIIIVSKKYITDTKYRIENKAKIMSIIKIIVSWNWTPRFAT
jgi:hypothetical protein